MNCEKSIASRHSFRSLPGQNPIPEYPGLSLDAREKVQQELKEHLPEIIKQLPERAAVVVMGSSDADRTKSTEKMVGEELVKMYQQNPEVAVVTISLAELQKIRNWRRYLKDLFEQVEQQHADKKLIVNCPPVVLKNFGGDSPGVIKNQRKAPMRNEIKEYWKGSDRIVELVSRFIKDRQLVPYNFIHAAQAGVVTENGPKVAEARPMLAKRIGYK